MKFQVGDRVVTFRYGMGTVTGINGVNLIIRWDYDGTSIAYLLDGRFQNTDHLPSVYHLGMQIIEAAPDRVLELAPFTKVLVRHSNIHEWRPDIYLYSFPRTSREKRPKTKHVCCNSAGWELQVIPYEGNEHLNGTSNAP